MKRLFSKRGGLKELVYDNTAMFLVVILIIIIIILNIVGPMKKNSETIDAHMEILNETIGEY